MLWSRLGCNHSDAQVCSDLHQTSRICRFGAAHVLRLWNLFHGFKGWCRQSPRVRWIKSRLWCSQPCTPCLHFFPSFQVMILDDKIIFLQVHHLFNANCYTGYPQGIVAFTFIKGTALLFSVARASVPHGKRPQWPRQSRMVDSVFRWKFSPGIIVKE